MYGHDIIPSGSLSVHRHVTLDNIGILNKNSVSPLSRKYAV